MTIWTTPSIRGVLLALALIASGLQTGCTSINRELLMGNASAAREMVRRGDGDVNQVADLTRGTPLMYVAERGDIEFVQALLDKGARTGARDSWDNTSAHYAARSAVGPGATSGRRLDILKLLIAHRESPTAVNERGHTLLHAALNLLPGDALQICEYLVGLGVAVDQASTAEGGIAGWNSRMAIGRMPVGTTPLMLAAKGANDDVVKLLLERGADPNKADGLGWTALHHAAGNFTPRMAFMLIDAGAVPADASGSASAMRATGRVHLLSAMRHAARGDREPALAALRTSIAATEASAGAFESEGRGQAVGTALLNALSFAGAATQARISAQQMASYSPGGRGVGVAAYALGSVEAPLRAGATLGGLALSEAAGVRALLGCVERAGSAEAVRACLPA